jgi:hypothetical protein
MRYDTPIYFQRITEGEYNANTGDCSPDTTSEVKVYASVTETAVDTLKLLYGDIKQGSLTIRLQVPYTMPFDRIRIGDKCYSVKLSRRGKAFFVSEVQ